MAQQRLIQLLKGGAVFGGFHFGENLLAGVRVVSVVHGEFNQFGQVGLAFKGHIRAFALHAGAHATEDDGQGTRLFQGDPARSEANQ